MDKRLFLGFRALWLLALIALAAAGEWSLVIFHGIVFMVTLPFLWVAWRDDYHHVLDGLFSLLLLASIPVSIFTVWPDYVTNFGYDKLYHMAGGAWLAGFAAVMLRKRVSDKAVFYTGIVVFAMAIGGAWEVFEWVLSLLPPGLATETPGIADAMLDIVADTIGAVVTAGVLWLRRYL